MDDININDENFNDMACIIKFILILDNSSKRLYSIYLRLKWGWGLGIGDWGLGIGPNPQSPIPNPQSPYKLQIL